MDFAYDIFINTNPRIAMRSLLLISWVGLASLIIATYFKFKIENEKKKAEDALLNSTDDDIVEVTEKHSPK